MVLATLPHLLEFWAFSSLTTHWAGLVKHPMKKEKRALFLKWKYVLNLLLVVFLLTVVIGLTLSVKAVKQDTRHPTAESMVLVASVGMGVVSLAQGLCFAYFALRLAKVLKKTRVRKTTSLCERWLALNLTKRMKVVGILVLFSFCAQSVMWILCAVALMARSMEGAENTTQLLMAYYCADLLGLWSVVWLYVYTIAGFMREAGTIKQAKSSRSLKSVVGVSTKTLNRDLEAPEISVSSKASRNGYADQLELSTQRVFRPTMVVSSNRVDSMDIARPSAPSLSAFESPTIPCLSSFDSSGVGRQGRFKKEEKEAREGLEGLDKGVVDFGETENGDQFSEAEKNHEFGETEKEGNDLDESVTVTAAGAAASDQSATDQCPGLEPAATPGMEGLQAVGRTLQAAATSRVEKSPSAQPEPEPDVLTLFADSGNETHETENSEKRKGESPPTPEDVEDSQPDSQMPSPYGSPSRLGDITGPNSRVPSPGPTFRRGILADESASSSSSAMAEISGSTSIFSSHGSSPRVSE
eukprot:gb/GEZN01003950.1/.p1 GENE.gb/GEZN01003950.1/~~gb/GEZN01003950.1/.p1  ORF type:complete len:576 (+),score=74.37 gb/GEZN01003950.1/:151-1728(+)